jgi:membrane protein required for colicin V production
VNWFDLALLIAVLSTIVIGFVRGFVRTAVSFIAFVAAIICGLWFYDPVGFWFMHFIKSKPAADAVGFFVVFAIIGTLGHVIERVALKFVRSSHLTWLDRTMGAAFGVLHGFLIMTAAVLIFMAFAPSPLPKAIAESRLVPMFEDAAHVLAATAPDPVMEGYYRARRDLEKVLPPEMQKQFEKLRARAAN